MTRNSSNPQIVSLSIRDIIGASLCASTIVVAIVYQSISIAVRLDRMESAIAGLQQSQQRLDRQIMLAPARSGFDPGGPLSR